MLEASFHESTRPNRPPIVMYSTTPWDGVWRPRREYALHLARRGWRVGYSTGPLTTWDRGTRAWQSAPLLGRISQDLSGVAIDQPGRLPPRWPGRDLLDRWVLGWHASRVRRSLAADRTSAIIAMVFDPLFLPHVLRLNPRFTVYFQYEALGHLPGGRRNFDDMEEQLVRRSDLVISLTPQMAEALPSSGRARAKILPSAVRFDEFRGALQQPCPDDLSRIPRPRVGYVGSITVALDFDLVAAVAHRHPDWQFVFVGPVESGGTTASLRDRVYDAKWQALRALANVHWLGPKPATAAPAYMAHMDVNALWYRTSGPGWWLAGSPIKLYENLAVGSPVVGTRLAAVREFSSVVRLADTPDEWQLALTDALARDSAAAAEARMAIAECNSWDRRTTTLEGWLHEMINARTGDGRGVR